MVANTGKYRRDCEKRAIIAERPINKKGGKRGEEKREGGEKGEKRGEERRREERRGRRGREGRRVKVNRVISLCVAVGFAH